MSPDTAGHVSSYLFTGGRQASTPTVEGQNRAGLVVGTCHSDSPLSETTPASATLEAAWIVPKQGSLGAWVAMVAAEFGPNKCEANRRWTGEGDSSAGRQRKEERGHPRILKRSNQKEE